MKRLVAGLFLLANIATPALADCVSTAHGGDLGTAALQALLAPANGGVYACYNPVPGNPSKRENNESLSGGVSGTFTEYHSGGSTQELNRGNYIILSASGGGEVKYTYTSGKSFSYYVCTDNTGTLYNFVNANTSAVYPVYVTTGPGSC